VVEDTQAVEVAVDMLEAEEEGAMGAVEAEDIHQAEAVGDQVVVAVIQVEEEEEAGVEAVMPNREEAAVIQVEVEAEAVAAIQVAEEEVAAVVEAVMQNLAEEAVIQVEEVAAKEEEEAVDILQAEGDQVVEAVTQAEVEAAVEAAILAAYPVDNSNDANLSQAHPAHQARLDHPETLEDPANLEATEKQLRLEEDAEEAADALHALMAHRDRPAQEVLQEGPVQTDSLDKMENKAEDSQDHRDQPEMEDRQDHQAEMDPRDNLEAQEPEELDRQEMEGNRN
jgi:hypothetical protein